jgi:hypothetical protein
MTNAKPISRFRKMLAVLALAGAATGPVLFVTASPADAGMICRTRSGC